MKIYQIFSRSALRNFSYLITYVDDEEKKAICIDPFDARQIMPIIRQHGLQLKAIINTHEHRDHFCGNESLVKETHCSVWGPAHVRDIIPGLNRELQEGEKIHLGKGGDYLVVLKTPGHTFNHICLMAYKDGNPHALFTGDTLFNAGVGNCHSGNPEVLYNTIKKKFFPLDESIFIYPGHDYLERNLNFTLSIEKENKLALELLHEMREKRERSEKEADQEGEETFKVLTFGEEKMVNPFLRLREVPVLKGLSRIHGDEKFCASNVSSVSENEMDKKIFLELRALRDRW